MPSELRALAAVAKVRGVREFADLLGVSRRASKSVRQTGASRQSELLKLVAGI